jgi:hypothetical protein
VPDLLEGVGGAYAIPPVSWKTRLTVRAQKIQNPAPDGVLNARRRKKGARKPLLDELNPMLPRRAIYCRFESGLSNRKNCSVGCLPGGPGVKVRVGQLVSWSVGHQPYLHPVQMTTPRPRRASPGGSGATFH